MQRATAASKKVDLFGSGKHGYTDGSPGVEAPTVLNSAAMNPIQEEIAQTIELLGLTVGGSANTQLAAALHMRRVQTAFGAGPAQSVTIAFASGKAFRSFATNGAGRIVGVGDGGLIGYSDDLGLTWSAATAAGSYVDPFYHVIWAGSQFVACGGNLGGTASIQTSPDGITWTQRASGASTAWYNVAWNGSVYVAQLWTGSAYAVYTSSTGVTWTASGVATVFGTAKDAVIAGGGVFVKGANTVTGTIYSSTDGLTWTNRSLGSSDAFQVDYLGYDAAYGFVAAGIDAAGVNKYLHYSPTGSIWVRVRKDLNGGLSVGGLLVTSKAAFVINETIARLSWSSYKGADSNAGGDFSAYNKSTRRWSTAMQVVSGSNTYVALMGNGTGIVDRIVWTD